MHKEKNHDPELNPNYHDQIFEIELNLDASPLLVGLKCSCPRINRFRFFEPQFSNWWLGKRDAGKAGEGLAID